MAHNTSCSAASDQVASVAEGSSGSCKHGCIERKYAAGLSPSQVSKNNKTALTVPIHVNDYSICLLLLHTGMSTSN